MRKIKLAVESLRVQSFTTSAGSDERGTVMGHAPTNGGGPNCGSAIDACPTGLCATLVPENCVTFDPQNCETADFGCSTAHGCTTVECP